MILGVLPSFKFEKFKAVLAGLDNADCEQVCKDVIVEIDRIVVS